LEKMKKGEDDRAALEKEKARKEEADQLKEPLITRVVPIAYNDPDKLKKNVEDLLKNTDAKDGKDPKQPADIKAASSPGSVTVDEHTRSLIIKATRRDMDSLLRFIAKVDKPTAQILIKANIVETTKSMARDLGITWGGQYNPTIGNHSAWITPNIGFPAMPLKGAAAVMGLSFGTLGGNILDLQLSALQKDGKLNILSSPSIITMDNQAAYTENGDEVPYQTTDCTGGVCTKSVKKEKATLRLDIEPHVIEGNKLKMDITVKKDEVDQSRNVDNNPYIKKKETKTTLMVEDGETIVISGLTKQKKEEGTTGLPWLKDTPILGWLFKGQQKSDSMEEVLIFITPTIIKPKTVAGIQTGP
jgi:type IV pilus assembly protein PilQ